MACSWVLGDNETRTHLNSLGTGLFNFLCCCVLGTGQAQLIPNYMYGYFLLLVGALLEGVVH